MEILQNEDKILSDTSVISLKLYIPFDNCHWETNFQTSGLGMQIHNV